MRTPTNHTMGEKCSILSNDFFNASLLELCRLFEIYDNNLITNEVSHSFLQLLLWSRHFYNFINKWCSISTLNLCIYTSAELAVGYIWKHEHIHSYLFLFKEVRTNSGWLWCVDYKHAQTFLKTDFHSDVVSWVDWLYKFKKLTLVTSASRLELLKCLLNF